MHTYIYTCWCTHICIHVYIWKEQTHTCTHTHTHVTDLNSSSILCYWISACKKSLHVLWREENLLIVQIEATRWLHSWQSANTHLNHMEVSHMPEESLLQEVSSTFFSSVGFLQGGGGGAVILCSVLCNICCQSSLSSHSFLLQSRSSCRATLSFSESRSWWITCERKIITIIIKVNKEKTSNKPVNNLRQTCSPKRF